MARIDGPCAYKATTVPAYQTREHIRELLRKHGASAVALQDVEVNGQRNVGLRFQRGDRVVRVQAVMGETAQEERQRLRALYWWLKTLLEQAEFGMLTFDELFLAHLEVALPGNRGTATVQEIVGPQLGRFELPDMSRLLKMLPPGEG